MTISQLLTCRTTDWNAHLNSSTVRNIQGNCSNLRKEVKANTAMLGTVESYAKVHIREITFTSYSPFTNCYTFQTAAANKEHIDMVESEMNELGLK